MSIDARNSGETFSMSGRVAEAMGLKARFHAMLVALSLAVSPNAFAQDKPAVIIATVNTSSSGVETGVQRIETAYGNLSFADIAKHEKKKEIVDKMSDADFDVFDKWMESRTQTAIRQNEQKLQIEQAAIARGVELDNEIYAKLIALRDRGDTLTEDDKRWLSEIEQRRKNGRPVLATNPK